MSNFFEFYNLMENSNSFIDPRRGRLLFPRSSPPPPALPSLPSTPLRYSYEMSLNVSYAPTSFQNKQWRLQPSIDSVGCRRISPWPLPPDESRAAAGRGSRSPGRDGAAAGLSPGGTPGPGGMALSSRAHAFSVEALVGRSAKRKVPDAQDEEPGTGCRQSRGAPETGW